MAELGAIYEGQAIVAGEAAGVALVSAEPLSFWGGYDHRTGEIIDRRHPLSGQIAAGRVLLVPFTRGSSTTTAVLLEAIRAGTAPAAIITTGPDSFLALASVVAGELHGRSVPLVALAQSDFAVIRSGQYVQVDPDGRVRVTDWASPPRG